MSGYSDANRRMICYWQRRFSSAILCVLPILAFSGYANGLVAAEPMPGSPYEHTYAGPSGPVQIVFRYCPAGSIKPGAPKAEATKAPGQQTSELALLLGDGSVRLPAFYVSETEVTIDQFAAVVSSEQMQRLRERNRQVHSGVPELIQQMDAGGELPVFMLSIEDALEFCRRLTSLDEAQSESNSIEGRVFRIPSHIEWQYACRAGVDAAAIEFTPHFNRWPDSYESLSREDRARSEEEWQAMGRSTEEFRGTQAQIAEMLEARQDFTNEKPTMILAAFLKAGIGGSRDYGNKQVSALLPVRMSNPNAWNIADMHDNVAEWTLAIQDRGEAQLFWERLVSEQLSGQDQEQRSFFIAGGSFNDSISDQNDSWKSFTIWGGFPMNKAANEVLPFSFFEAQESNYDQDRLPGLRLVMDRVLRDLWLNVVRQNVLKGQLSDTEIDNFEGYRSIVRAVVPSASQTRPLAMLEYYHALADHRRGKSDEAAMRLSKNKADLFATQPKQQKGLAALLDSGQSTQQQDREVEPISADSFYVEVLTGLMARDTTRIN